MDASQRCVGLCVCLVAVCLHLDPLLLAELRQGLLDPESREAGGTVGIPTFPHYLCHHPQGLQSTEDTAVNIILARHDAGAV